PNTPTERPMIESSPEKMAPAHRTAALPASALEHTDRLVGGDRVEPGHLAGRELDHDVDRRPRSQAIVAFGLRGAVGTGGDLEIVLAHLFEPEQLIGAGREDADLCAGGANVAVEADRANVQPVLCRQVVAIDVQRAIGERLVVADDVDVAVAIDVAET